MPNWCSNTFDVSHPDQEMIAKFAKAMDDGKLFQTFVPHPSQEWEYGWAVENWGTKWDVANGFAEIDEDPNYCQGWFDTAWGPPIPFYRRLTELGFEVNATFIETGMCFCGTYTSEEDEKYFEYDFSDWEWKGKYMDRVGNEDLLETLLSEYEFWLEQGAEEDQVLGEDD